MQNVSRVKFLIIAASFVLITLSLVFSFKIHKLSKVIRNENSLVKVEIDKVSQEMQLLKEKLEIDEKRSKLAKLLLTYSAKDENGPLKLIRHGRANDGGYVVPELSFITADALIGYGIADDISFEEQFSNIFNKPSYGFDCGIQNIHSNSKLFTFVKECIATDDFLYSKKDSSKEISSFTQQINKYSLQNQKVFIKMDIEGAEYNAFEDIYKYAATITGIVLEIHFNNKSNESIEKVLKLLFNLKENFLLLHIHGNNCIGDFNATTFTSKHSLGNIPQVLELTYINKNLVKSFEISENQRHPNNLDMSNCVNAPDTVFEILP